MTVNNQTVDINLHAKLVETIAPLLTRQEGLSAGLVGRATLKRAERIVDAALALIAGEGCKIVQVPNE